MKQKKRGEGCVQSYATAKDKFNATLRLSISSIPAPLFL